ncbi:sensor histidine kinase [Actinomadura napierensis]|uniref:sensor histidine kinase n=1 Tax=Actinomadura napierensis TaxID=267854 RepID=UPI00387EC1E0
MGIPAEYQEKIFVIFQRLHGRDAYSGTGIGLALCKKIVEYHGGRIWLDPEHPDGARFHFTFPAPDPTDTDPTDTDPTETDEATEEAIAGRPDDPSAPPGTGTSGTASSSTDLQGASS